MARKKKEQAVDLSNDTRSIQDIFNESMKSEFETDDSPITLIPTGIDLLDGVLGGGVATHLVQIVGNPGSSKSTLAARILAESDKRFKKNFLSVYIDSEQSMSEERLRSLGMVNPSQIVSSKITIESILKTVEKACLVKSNLDSQEILNTPSIIVWDSIANTLTEKSYEDEDVGLSDKARVLSNKLPRITDMLKAYKIGLISINQLRDNINIGVMRKQSDLKFLYDKNVPGGKSLLFNSYQIIYLQQGTEIVAETDGNKLNLGFNGMLIKAKTIKNKSFTPNIDVELAMSYNRGYSNFWTNFLLLKKFNRISVTGAWSCLRGCEENKFYQKEALKLYNDNEKFRSYFNEYVTEVIQTEYIEKYKNLGENVEYIENNEIESSAQELNQEEDVFSTDVSNDDFNEEV